MRTFLLIFSMSFFLVFSSCNEQESTTITDVPVDESKVNDVPPILDKSKVNQSVTCSQEFLEKQLKETHDSLFKGAKYEYDIDKMKSDLITPKALACDYVEYVWVTHHYGAKAGKFIGSWPRSARKNDTERMRALKDKYGFSYIGFGYAQSVFNRALSVDFSKENIMIGINDQNWQSTINTVQSVYGNIYGYYLDEPIYHEYNPDCGYIIKSYLVNNSYSSLFLTGDFKRIWPLGWIVENADKVLFTAYTKWWLLFGFWVSCCPWNPDQRSNWTDFRSSFGTKFSSTWVGAHKDLSEYDLLLGHAQNLNLDGVWLYQSQDITDDYDDNNVSEFSYSAWRHGFLRKWVQDVKLTWRCTITNPCGCDPICFPEHYYLYSIEYGTTIKEVFP